MAEEDGVDQQGLGHLPGEPLDHDDGVVGAGHDQVDLGFLALGVGRVQDERSVQAADAHGAHGRVERHAGTDERH